MNALLEFDGVGVRFGAVRALDDVSICVPEHAMLGLIGPNGAGKSTLFNVISGVTKPSQGTILFRDRRIDGQTITKIARSGIARTFQNLRLFAQMSVLENVLVGEQASLHANLFDNLFNTKRRRIEEAMACERAMEYLRFVGLDKHAQKTAGSLAYGQARRLEIARALGADPLMLLLDEPAAGLNATEKHELAALVRVIHERGVSVMLVEHDMGFVMPLCERIAVLDYGRVIAHGTPEEIRSDPRVVDAYLGTGGESS